MAKLPNKDERVQSPFALLFTCGHMQYAIGGWEGPPPKVGQLAWCREHNDPHEVKDVRKFYKH